MQIAPLDFPKHLPHGYAELDGEPAFDAARHLSLERPTEHWTLEDFGYDAETIDAAPSPLAITAPFRMLSAEGAATLEEVALELRRFAQQARAIKDFKSNRNQTYLAGGVYRSRFLRDLCHCPEVLAFCSELVGTPLAAHSLPSQQVYINYAPEQLTADVDVWHADSICFDYVLLASDPATFDGGNFEFFVGTRGEAAGYLGLPADRLNRGRAEGIPADRIRSAAFPGPGFAIFQQGNYVVHRARRLNRPAQRVSVVPGLVPLHSHYDDKTDLSRIATYGEPGIAAEIARHGAWLAQAKLGAFLSELDINADFDSLRDQLASAAADIDRTLTALERRPEATR